MPTLIITRGLQGSGKSTRARAWVAEDPAHRARINRDNLRTQLHDGVWLGPATETQIVAVRDAAIQALLRKGTNVICDDTNLPQRTARDLARLAALAGAELEVWDLTDVPVDECVTRDAQRTGTARRRGRHPRHAPPLPGRQETPPTVAGGSRGSSTRGHVPPTCRRPAPLAR